MLHASGRVQRVVIDDIVCNIQFIMYYSFPEKSL